MKTFMVETSYYQPSTMLCELLRYLRERHLSMLGVLACVCVDSPILCLQTPLCPQEQVPLGATGGKCKRESYSRVCKYGFEWLCVLTLLRVQPLHMSNLTEPHTTHTVPSSATTKALSIAGMHVLCDTPHATSPYVRCTSDCVWTHQSCVVVFVRRNKFHWGQLEGSAKEKVTQGFVSMPLNGCVC